MNFHIYSHTYLECEAEYISLSAKMNEVFLCPAPVLEEYRPFQHQSDLHIE